MENVEIKEEVKEEVKKEKKSVKKAAKKKESSKAAFMRHMNEMRKKNKMPAAYSEEEISKA
jgi:hypothetical protein